MSTHRAFRAGIAAAWISAAASLAPGASAGPSASAVHIRNFHFEPETLEVPVGATVSWTNDDGELHAVLSPDGAVRSPGIDAQESYTHAFTNPGVYEYRCPLHPQMTGRIVVR